MSTVTNAPVKPARNRAFWRWIGGGTLVVLAVVFAWALHQRVSNYQRFFDYDVTSDYVCVYDPTRGQSVALQPEAGGLAWPPGARDVTALRNNPLDQDRRPREATWRNLVADMAQLLAKIRPSSVVLPHPQLDANPDHRFTTIALLEALESSDLPQGRLLFYINHSAGSELYPFGPRDGIVSIPPMHTGHRYFQSVLSYPLSLQQQWRKSIALQAEHALSGWIFANTWSLWRPWDLRSLKDADVTYGRRMVRPNELFLVVDYDQASRVVEGFITSEAAEAAPLIPEHHEPR